MTNSQCHATAMHVQEVTDRLVKALAFLRNNPDDIPLPRARAIAVHAARLIDTVKLEAPQAHTTQEHP